MDERRHCLSLLFAAADVGRSVNIKCERQNAAREWRASFTVCAPGSEPESELRARLIYGRS
jgi:hypothetical protein